MKTYNKVGIAAVIVISLLFTSFNNNKSDVSARVRVPAEIDDKFLHLFSEEHKLDSTKGSFTGFPTAVVHKGTLYLLYSYHSQHQSVPGVEQDFRYYRFSKDGGKTWSERKQLKMPASKIRGISYDYRSLELIDAGNKILGLGVIAPSDTGAVKPYRPYFCQLRAKRNGELKYSRFKMLPHVNEDGKKVDDPAVPGDKKGSNIVAGNILLIDGQLYWCYYNSVRNVQLLRWDSRRGRVPEKETVEVLANIGDNSKEHLFSEVGMFHENGIIYMSVRDEKATNSNWKYDIRKATLTHIGNTSSRAFGPNIFKPRSGPALLTGRQYTYLKSQEQLTRMDNMILLSPDGKILKENIGFVGHLMGGDSMYCSTVELEGTIFIFYYYGMNSSKVQANSRYFIAYKTIRIEDLRKMME